MSDPHGAAGVPAGETAVKVEVNDRIEEFPVRDQETLLETLRERFGLTSVRSACGIGMCGTCTVHVDGRAVSSCLTLTQQVDGKVVRTSEGLVVDGALDPVQQAFVASEAYQCSFCIPGAVMAVRALLDAEPDATVERARDELAGNLCRCGTYPWIVDALAHLFREAPASG